MEGSQVLSYGSWLGVCAWLSGESGVEQGLIRTCSLGPYLDMASVA